MKLRLLIVVLVLAVMVLAPNSGTSQSSTAQSDASIYDPSDPNAQPNGFVVSKRQQFREQIQADLTSYCVEDDTEHGNAFDFSLSNQRWTLYYNKGPIANGIGFISRAGDDIVIDSFFGDWNIVGVVQPFYKRASLTIWYGHSASFTITDSNLDDSSCTFTAPPPPPPNPQAGKICFIETRDYNWNPAQIIFNTTDKTWVATWRNPSGTVTDLIEGTYSDGPLLDGGGNRISVMPPVDNAGDRASWYVHGTGRYKFGKYTGDAGSDVTLNYAARFDGNVPGGQKRGLAYIFPITVNERFSASAQVEDRKLEGGCR